jgi:hypothetical protein
MGYVCPGRVEDGRGSLGHSATPRFPSPLIKPNVPISGIRLSDWLHRETHAAFPKWQRAQGPEQRRRQRFLISLNRSGRAASHSTPTRSMYGMRPANSAS